MSQSTECSLLAFSSCSKPKLKVKGSFSWLDLKKKKKKLVMVHFPQSVHRLDSSLKLQRVRVRASLGFAVEYSKLSLRTGTPLGPALSVCLRERCQGGKKSRTNSRCPLRESRLYNRYHLTVS